MKFDEQTHKVEILTLSKVGAKAYIDFLLEEKERHTVCLKVTGERARSVDTCGNEYWEARGKFWESAVARHRDDISDIKALIEKVRELFE